jgi:hypothetical protein
VKNRFQNLPFKCNLQRYSVALVAKTVQFRATVEASRMMLMGVASGLGSRGGVGGGVIIGGGGGAEGSGGGGVGAHAEGGDVSDAAGAGPWERGSVIGGVVGEGLDAATSVGRVTS